MNESTLEEVNTLTSSLLACVLKHFNKLPETLPNKTNCPGSKEEWTDILLHILFEASAMSYKTADLKTKKLKEFTGEICGEPCKSHFLGSFADGLGCAMPGRYSDTDIMNVLTSFYAVHEHDIDVEGSLDYENISSVREQIELSKGSYPCYVKLKQTEAFSKLSKITEATNYGPVIRSEEREELLHHTFEFDNAISMQCKEWPVEAQSWKTRHRIAQWPISKQKEQCCNIPCYIVPKPHALNASDKSEWRYSFARQEKKLLKDLPIAIKRAYVIAKYLIKQEIPSDDLLSTYHIKTLLMWHCEQKSENQFKFQTLYSNVIDFLDFILQNLRKHQISHYFIPGNNMIEHISPTSLQNIIESIQMVRDDPLGTLSRTKTVLKNCPFEIQHLARALLDDEEDEQLIFRKCQSLCLFMAIDILFESHLPHFDSIWNFVQYVIPFASISGETCSLLMTSQNLMKQSEISKTSEKVFGNPYVCLVTLILALYNEMRLEISLLPNIDLERCINTEENENVSLELVLAKVFLFVGLESHSKTTRMLCYLVHGVLQNRNILQHLLIQTLKSFLFVLLVMPGGNIPKHRYLLQRFKEITVIFQASVTDIEVCIAVVTRLQRSDTDALKILQIICDLCTDVTMNGVMKQLVFAIFLCIENETVTNETSSQWMSTTALLKSETVPQAWDAFLFVSVTCIFHKIVNGKSTEIREFLGGIKSAKINTDHEDIEEMIEIFKTIMQSQSVDFQMAFETQCCYAKEYIEKLGVTFVVNVMDDLLKPHHNLGVLSAVGIELTATDRLDDAIQVLELWSKRYLEAPVEQNPKLIVKVFSKLGHLYHIKWSHKPTRMFSEKAHIMFQSAHQEEVPDIDLIIGHVLFRVAQNTSCAHEYLKKALPVMEPLQVSSYFKMSLPAFGTELSDVREIIEENGNIMISSAILVIYMMVVMDDKVRTKDLKDPLFNIIDTMERMLKENDADDQDTNETQKNIFRSSCMIASKAASRLGLELEGTQYMSKANSCG